MPRSPCSESTGWRNIAGVPVDVNVAAILRAISPDFPTPEMMTRPLAPARISTARAKAGPNVSATRWTAAASSASTRLPRSTSCLPPACGVGARTGLCTHGLPHAVPDLDRQAHDPGELIGRGHVGSIRWHALRVWISFEENNIRTRGGGSVY